MNSITTSKKFIIAAAAVSTLAVAMSLGAVAANAATKSVDLGQVQVVTWQSPNYETNDVTVSVIRKVADNPARYELVRTVASDMSNSGAATWVPSRLDVGGDDLIQVGCKLSANACRAGISEDQLSVIYSDQYLNTANAYQAIEQMNDK